MKLRMKVAEVRKFHGRAVADKNPADRKEVVCYEVRLVLAEGQAGLLATESWMSLTYIQPAGEKMAVEPGQEVVMQWGEDGQPAPQWN